MRRLPDIPAKPKRRITLGTAIHMIVVAAMFDTLQFGIGALLPVGVASLMLPVAGIPISIAIVSFAILANCAVYMFSFMTFFTWFTFRDVSLGLVDRFAIKRFVVWIFTTGTEVLAGAVPATTIGVIATIVIVAEEDRQRLREWEGKLRMFEKLAWGLMKSGGNPEVAIVRLLRSARLERSERLRLQKIRNQSAVERRERLMSDDMRTESPQSRQNDALDTTRYGVAQAA